MSKPTKVTECCVSCGVRLDLCQCEFGIHFYGDMHDEDCPRFCPKRNYKVVNGVLVRK